MHLNRYVLIFPALFCLVSAYLSAYDLQFTGIPDENARKVVYSVSQLEKLKSTPPATLLGLRRRAEADVLTILQGLHSLAYFNAKVDFSIEEDGGRVTVKIDSGPVYPLAEYFIRYTRNGETLDELPKPISPADLKIQIGKPALPEAILISEELLLDKLNLQGFAFASIKKKDVLADQMKHHVVVLIDVETGPLTYFGPLTISGEERVKKKFIYKKLKWHEGDLYDPDKIEKTQEALELTGLFKSVTLTHADQPKEKDYIPFKLSVVEAKQRSIGFGVSYNTELGPGITGEWEDRNIFGEGEKLSFRADLWKIRQEGRLAYLIPEYKSANQSLIWILDYRHDITKGFTDSTFSLSSVIERKLNKRLRMSYGGMYKLIDSRHSDLNGVSNLIQTPLQLRWSTVINEQDPSDGYTINLKAIPSLQFSEPQFVFCINTFTGSLYRSLTKDKRHIVAAKLMLGSTIGAGKNEIPPPERFYAGSENALRGYNYLTVSPLGKHYKPLGGRSLFIYSLEFRNKIGKNFGWVAFYEIGNVYFKEYPNLNKPMLQSAGFGLRYYTPIGPLRLDLAFPLNRRPHVDGPMQLYFSIGQSF